MSIYLSLILYIYIYIYIYIYNRDIGPAVRVFANGPGDLGSIPGRVIPKTLKMELDTTLLNTQHYKVRFKGKVEQSREWSSEKGAFGSPSTMVANFTYYIYIYIYIVPFLSIYIHIYRFIDKGQFIVFANGPGDLGSIPGRVIPKTLKMVLNTSLLNTQQYKVRIKGKVRQSRGRSSTLPYTLV